MEAIPEGHVCSECGETERHADTCSVGPAFAEERCESGFEIDKAPDLAGHEHHCKYCGVAYDHADDCVRPIGYQPSLADEPINETETPEATITRLARALGVAEQQRDFLLRQADSLVQRLAGAHVAAGLIDLNAAQGFIQKEILPLNTVLAGMAAANQETDDGAQ